MGGKPWEAAWGQGGLPGGGNLDEYQLLGSANPLSLQGKKFVGDLQPDGRIVWQETGQVFNHPIHPSGQSRAAGPPCQKGYLAGIWPVESGGSNRFLTIQCPVIFLLSLCLGFLSKLPQHFSPTQQLVRASSSFWQPSNSSMLYREARSRWEVSFLRASQF